MRIISKKPLRDFWERHPEARPMLEEWFSKATHCQAGSFVTRRQTFGAADSEEEYAQVTDLLNNLLDIVRDNTQHSLYSLMSVVGDLIEAYEIERHSPHQT